MLKIENLSKSFDNKLIYKDISIIFEEQKIYSIFGINGAGKSTFLRTISGIFIQDSGNITLDGRDVQKDTSCKEDIFYIADEEINFPRKNIDECIEFYKCFYRTFSRETFVGLQEIFKLNTKENINNFSKGMKKQAILLTILPFLPKYLILDETFDGVDPLIKVKLKKYLIDLVETENITLIVSSHNISDIENFADDFYVLDKNTLMVNFIENIENYQRVEFLLPDGILLESLGLNVLESRKIGRSYSLLVKNKKEEIFSKLNAFNVTDIELSEITKEELFLQEVEGK